MLTNLDTGIKITGNPKITITIDVKFISNRNELYVKSISNPSIFDNYINNYIKMDMGSYFSRCMLFFKKIIK